MAIRNPSIKKCTLFCSGRFHGATRLPITGSVSSIVVLYVFLQMHVPPARAIGDDNQGANRALVGSKICAQCHRSIYESFSRTDMARSMSEITPSLLEKLPTSVNIFDPKLNRHFELYVRNSNLYQSEYGTSSEGAEVFRETQKLEWIIGSGANGRGAIVRRSDYLFEAPLSYYTKMRGWALSPGYEFGDYGFNRPILPGCISCHSGQPQPVLEGNGRFRDPPFMELPL